MLKCHTRSVLVCVKCLEKRFKVKKSEIKKMKTNKLSYICCGCIVEELEEEKANKKKKNKNKKPSRKRQRKK